MDSSSGASPFSSLVTIVSSSARAASKLMAVMSARFMAFMPFMSVSPPHEREHMLFHGTRQAVEIISAFEHRNHAPAGETVCGLHDLARDPAEIPLGELEIGERVAPMGVKARRDHHEVRAEALERRQDARFDGLAEGVAAVAGPKRRVHD